MSMYSVPQYGGIHSKLFNNMAEAVNVGTPIRGHFISMFEGATVDDNTWEVVGTSPAFSDTVDGGLLFSQSTTGNSRIESNTRFLDIQNCTYIIVARHNNIVTGEQATRMGHSSSANVFGDNRLYISKSQNPSTVIRHTQKNAADGFVATDFGTAAETTNYHMYKISSFSTFGMSWMDGVLEAVGGTSGFPTSDVSHPWVYNQRVAGTATVTLEVKYLEAFNH